MLKIVTRRLLIAIPTLIVVASLTFLLMKFIPGDPAVTILGPDATAEEYERVRVALGLDRPLFVQYAAWMGDAVQGDLGTSLQNGQPVTALIATRLPVTLALASLSVIVTALIGVLLGTIAALSRGRLGRVVQVLSIVGSSIPNFWLAILLVIFLSVNLRLLPAAGFVPIQESFIGWASSLVLPVVAIAFAGIAAIARQTRGAVTDVLSREYVRTMRAVGTPPSVIVFKHVLRNAAIPVTTTLGFQFVLILSGAIVIERVFALPGIGQLLLSAIATRDIAVVQGVVAVTTVIVVIVNLVVDVVNALLNPKMRIS